jgi:hypothetical protein
MTMQCLAYEIKYIRIIDELAYFNISKNPRFLYRDFEILNLTHRLFKVTSGK